MSRSPSFSLDALTRVLSLGRSDDQACTCVIQCGAEATSSMRNCPDHGDQEEEQ